jgi:homogentisate 1,2-dioxygenase
MFHYSQGKHTTQGHKAIPEGCFEEEQGRKGFSGPVSHLIKEKPSTRWTGIEGNLRPHLYDSNKIDTDSTNWIRMFHNQDVCVYTQGITPQKASLTHSYRNADGETLYFCHKGQGFFITEYGMLKFEKGSYILIPKCVNYSILPSESTNFLIIESKTGLYREPDRGMVGRNAFYDTEAFGAPDLEAQKQILKNQNLKFTEIVVKRGDEFTRFKYQDCVYDTVGWKGDFFPISLHVDDLMPMLSARVHLPPSAHCTFVSNNFVICTFLPRPLESDADALKVPFYHQNIDYDEVLFYHAGDFFSRDNIKPGAISFHPAGFPHGPHPKATEKVKTQTHTNEYAVMIDTWNPLYVDQALTETEVTDYWKSWMK